MRLGEFLKSIKRFPHSVAEARKIRAFLSEETPHVSGNAVHLPYAFCRVPYFCRVNAVRLPYLFFKKPYTCRIGVYNLFIGFFLRSARYTTHRRSFFHTNRGVINLMSYNTSYHSVDICSIISRRSFLSCEVSLNSAIDTI